MTEERAAEVIMTARAPWFAEEEEARLRMWAEHALEELSGSGR